MSKYKTSKYWQKRRILSDLRTKQIVSESMPPARPHTFSHTLLTGVALGVLLTATPALTPITAAYANPAGGNVVAGSASFSYNGNTLTVDQHSQRAVIEWQDFSVGAGELTQFLQNNKNAAVLNKVISSLPSSILGQIKANGNVFLVNPNGIVIGKGARIDTNSFVATALNVSSQQFMDGGDMTFSGESAAAVINLGEIHAGNGDIYLIARQVTNEGGLYAPNGEVGLAAGREIYLSTQGVTGSRITVRDDGLAEEISEHLQDGAAIDNQGVIEAARIVLAARSQDLYDVAINNNGTIRAMGIESNPNGTIRLVATGGGGNITHSGTMTAKNYTSSGGRVEVLGDHITLKSGSLIDVSGTGTADSAPDKATHENRGENGGGTVLIGGDYKGGNDVQTAKSVMIESGATIRANGEGTGDGGKIIVWSDESTEVAGTLEAMGGENGGNGGFIETSSKKDLTIADSVQIHISAPARAIDSEMTNQWRGGQWFLDPEDILIADSGGDISTASINSVLSADGDVTIETDSMAAGNGDITIDNATIVKSGSSGDSELILIADRNIIMTNSSVTVTGGGALSMTFNAAAAGTNDGSIVLDTSSISTNGGAVIMGGGADPTTQAAFGNASYYNNGITIIDSDITTDAGLILMNGQGRGNSGAGNQNGISFVASTLTTTTGTITLNGTGGAGDDDNRGIIMGGSGGVDVVITSAEGAITLTGVGGSNGNDSSVDNYGIHLTADVHITSTGTGAGAATITLNGTGGAGGDANRGVELGGGGTTNTYISSIDGDINITGQGGSNGNAGSNNNFGIRLTNGAYIESTGTTADAATITLDGTGGAGEDNNYGLAIVGSGATPAYVTSAYGAIDITGQGGSNGGGDSSDNYGIYITDGGYISSTGTGASAATITLAGTGGSGGEGTNHGVHIDGNDDTNTYITSIDGAIDITGQSNGTGDDNYGINLIDGGYISSTGTGANAATITLDGTGGNGNTANRGISLNKDVAASAASHITSVDGDISLTGVGQGDGHNNYGISIFRNSYITSTGTTTDAATITLHGTAGGAGGTFENDGVRLRGVNDGTATISSVMGDISITGIGGDGTYSNRGFYLADSAAVISTGTGANAATITIDGTGGAGGDTNHGVQIDAAGGATTYITSVDGDIDITGQGGSSGAGSSDSNYGIYLYQGAYITSTGTTTDAATITLDGTGGGGYFDNDGIRIRGDGTSTHITSDMGNISLTGQGGSNGSAGSYGNRGIIIYQDAQIISTGTGANAATITLDGTGGAGENTNHGVVINGQSGSNTFITSVDGAIDITGQGGGLGNNNSSTNYGIFIYDGAYISSTGTGVNAATITLSGTGSAGEDTNVGVNIDGDGATNTYISTVDGAIDITAQGGSNGTGGSNYNYGMRLGDGAYITSTGGGVTAGTITINATAGAGQANNYGLIMNGGGAGSASISSARGAVDIIGESAGNGTGNYAVYVLGGADFDMNGSASLTITANGTASGSTNTDAFRMETSGTAITLENGDFLLTATVLSNDVNDDAILTFDGTTIESTGTGNITLHAINSNSGRSLNINSTLHQSGSGNITVIGDDLIISSTADIMTASGDITIAPHTDSTTIGLGTAAAGTLHLDDDELTYIDAGGTFIIGTIGTGSGTIDLDAWDLSSTTYNVELYGGPIDIGGVTLGTGDFMAHAQDDRDLLVSVAITKSLAGASTVDLRADDQITLDDDISATGGSINVILNSDRDADMLGGIDINGAANVLTNGGYAVLGGGSGDIGGTNGILGDGDGTGADDMYAYGNDTKFGIKVSGSIATDDGDIIINGHGEIAGSSNWANGIAISGNIFTDNGDITIRGKADDSQTGDGEAGINMNNNAYIESTGTGNIYIYAESSANGGSSSAGLRLIHADTHIGVNDGDLVIDLYSDNTNAATLFFDGSVTNGLRSTGDGDITVTTMGSSGNRNISAETLIGGSGMNGDIILNIDNIGLLQDTYSLQTNGDIYILPYTDSTTIGIGSASTGDLNFTDAELGRISAGGKLVIGNSGTGTGAVDVDSWDLSGFTYDVELYGGAIDMGGITLGTGTFTAHAQNDQDLNISNTITKALAGDSTLTLRADKNLFVNSNITASTGSLDIIVNSDRDADQDGGVWFITTTVTSNGGDITVGGGLDPSTTAAWGTANTNENGIGVSNSTLSAGAGNISLIGQGLVASTTGYQNGISMGGTSTVSTTTGDITMIGTGGEANSDYNSGIRLSGTGGLISIATTSGNITLTGTGGSDGTAGSHNNFGLYIENNVHITSTGTGATAGTITLDGTGGDGEDRNYGVYIDGNGGTNTYITSVDGAISITGQGGSNGAVASEENYGTYIYDGAYIESTGTGTDAATITITGTGGAGETGNRGFRLEGTASISSYITSVDGAIDITGNGNTSNSSAGANHGILLHNNAYIESTGTTADAATITLTGTTNSLSGSSILFNGTVNNVHITSAYGDINLTGGGDGFGQVGIYMSSDAYIESTGTGTNAATITLNGTGGDGEDANYGVFMDGNNGTDTYITSVDGAISITGQGGSNGAATSEDNFGIYLYHGAYIESTGTGANAATITLDGTGGAGEIGNRGLRLEGSASAATYVTSVDGAIDLTGHGSGASGSSSHGILIYNNAYIESTGTTADAATITLTGTTDSMDSFGIIVNGDANTVYITSAYGDISLTGGGNGFGQLGINITDDAYIESTGTTADAATITLDGSAGSRSSDSNYGVLIQNSGAHITSAYGAIDITGQGGGDSNSSDNHGIDLYNGGYIESTGTGTNAATITLNGTGGAGEDQNYGVLIRSSTSYITSVDGAINITGTGASNGTSGSGQNYGVYLYNGSYIESTGTTTDAATITLDGTGGTGEDQNFGIALDGSGTTGVYITSAYGAIDMTGIAGSTGTNASSGNRGINITDDVHITSTGTGINAATITLNGTGGDGEDNNFGVFLDRLAATDTYISSIDGDITITGQGGSNGTDGSDYNKGIDIRDGARIISTGTGTNAANITLNGTAAAGHSDNYGVHLDGFDGTDTFITSVDGNIDITGQGASNGASDSNNNYGIFIYEGAYIQSTGTGTDAGTITLDGTGGNGGRANRGILLGKSTGVTNTSYITSVDGNINITGTGNGNDNKNSGISMSRDAYITSTGTSTDAATITITATGANGTTENDGLRMNGASEGTSTISSVIGDINITAQAGSDGSSNNNIGLYMLDDAVITSTGTGANAATITINATGGAGDISNHGIYLDGNGGTNTYITSIDGAIDMTGTGASNGAGSSTDNYGIYIYDGAYIESTGTGTDAATITLDGTGGAGKEFNHGILIDGNSNTATRITSVDGAIDMTGQGGSNGASNSSANRGIHMAGGASITSTGTTTDAATITLDGTGGAGGEEFNHGITVKDTNSLISSVIGAIDITGQGGGDGSDGSTGNFGVNIHTSARVTSTGTGANAATITITGTGGSGSGSNHGIWFGSSGLITSVDGDIALTGTGQSNGNSGANYGMQITGGARIRSTGTGSNAASITLDGTGGDGISNNHGVYIVGSSPTYITSIDGDIDITGQGGSNGAGDSSNNDGIHFDDGAYIESTGTTTDAATITLNGTGGAGENNNYGMILNGYDATDTYITSAYGDISLTGQGGTNGSSTSHDNYGVRIYDGFVLSSTGTTVDAATITVNGTGGAGDEYNTGLNIDDTGTANTLITSAYGDITLTGQGGSDGSDDSSNNYGVFIASGGATISSTGTGATAATITIDGTGGAGEDVNYGVYIRGSTPPEITSIDGAIDITGQGGSNGTSGSNSNVGIYIYSGVHIESTGTGSDAATITLDGTGGNGEDGNSGIYLNGNGGNDTYITSVDGAIDLTGQGGTNGSNLSDSNYGLYIHNGAYIESTGTTADAATITLNGTGGNGKGLNLGVRITGNSGVTSYITSAYGDIDITGQGSSNGTSSSSNNRGIFLYDGAQITSTGTGASAATITLNGTGGAGEDTNHGVYLYDIGGNNTFITSVDGAIDITGQGGSNGSVVSNENHGIFLIHGAYISSTGTGTNAATITLDGTSGAGHTVNNGVRIEGSSAASYITSVDGAIDISGTGTSNGTAGNGSNRGIVIHNSGYISSTGTGTDAATITLNGTGALNGDDVNSGFYMDANSGSSAYVTSVDGDIDITGTGGSSGISNSNQNDGIYLIEGSQITSTGTGANAATITLNGTGANGDNNNNNGIRLETGSIVSSAEGDVTLLASATDTKGYAVNIDATSVISTTAGTTDITITATNEDIALAGNITATGDVAITTPDTIIYGGGTWTGGTLTVNTGDMTGGPALANISTLDYTTGGAFGLTNAGNLSITNGVSTGAGSIDIATTAGDIYITSGLTLFGDTTITAGGESDITTTGALTSDDTAASALTFTAGGSFFFSAGDITNSNAAELDVTIHADSNSSESGAIALPNITITTNGGDVVMGGGADATTNAAWGTASNIAGIELNGTTINTGAGTITLTGHGDDESAVSNQHGVYLINGATLTSTTGAITVNGTGGDGVNNNRGIHLSGGSGTSYITSANGNITLTGQGGSNGGGSSNSNRGIYMGEAAYISSTGTGASAATITLDGTGGAGEDYNYGIHIDGNASASTYVTSVDGAINIIGQGGTNGSATGSQSNGIYIEDGAYIESTGTTADAATITLNGTGGNTQDRNKGVTIAGNNNSGTGVISAYGNITVTGIGGSDGADSNASVYSHGIYITAQGNISSTGTGANAATITLNGTGGAGEDDNRGLLIASDGFITSVDGDIDITGQGGSNGTAGSNNSYGIHLYNGAYIESTGTTADAATITLDGSAGACAGNCYGTYLDGSAASGVYITSVNGAIDITGQGGSIGDNTSNANRGINIEDQAYISSTGTGANAATITLNGTGGDGETSNHGVRIYGNGSNNAYITSVDGDIHITGQGGSNNTTGSGYNYGVIVYDGGYISSTGTTGDAATITVNGTGAAGENGNFGIVLDGNGGTDTYITSTYGDVNMTGNGTAHSTVGNNNNHGIYLKDGGRVSSTGTGANAAGITLTGTAGTGHDNNHGVYLHGSGGSSTYVSSVDGAIDIIGTGHGSGTNNNGIYIYDGAYITSTGATTADISLRGTAGPNSTDILIDTSATLSSAGDLDLTQNTLDLTAGALSAADDINITTRTAGAGIGLGGGAGILNITDAEIALIDAGDTLRINGNADVNIDSLNTTGSSQNLSISGATVTGVGGVQSGGTLRINAKTGNLKLSGPIAATGTGRTLTLASQKRDVLMNGATVNTGAGFAAIYASSPLSSHFGGFVTSYDIKYGIAYDTFTGTGNTLLYRTSDIDTRPILRNLLVQAGTTGHGSLNSFDNQTQHPTLKHYESDKVVDTTATQGKAGEFVILNTDAINTDKTPAQENAALTPQSGDDMLAPTPNTTEVQINTCTGSDDDASGQCSSTGSQGGA